MPRRKVAKKARSLSQKSIYLHLFTFTKEEPKLNTILNLSIDISIATESRTDLNKVSITSGINRIQMGAHYSTLQGQQWKA